MITNISGSYSYLQSAMTTGGKSSQTSATAIEFSAQISVETVEESQPTVEDIKKEFAAFLDSLQITQKGTAITVSVSDSAWEKMAADPEYKQKMMDLCKRDLCDPAWETKVPSPAVTTIRIDADAEEEYMASGYGAAVTHMADTSNSFWERRSERNKAFIEEMEERALEKKQMMEIFQQKGQQWKSLWGGSESPTSVGDIASRYFPSVTSGASSIFSSSSFI